MRRWATLLGKALLAGAVGGVLGLLAFAVYVVSLPPLDMDAANERSAVVLDKNGQLLRPFTTPDGRWRLPVEVSNIDANYLKILLGFEDRRFYSHSGVDLFAVMRAGGQLARRGRVISGGSTLTMQVARLLEPRSERSLSAKIRQAARAIQLEFRYSKSEILQFYLALAPFGGNVEGVRAASLAYFGKEPKRLSYAESALLVALPQSPEFRRPDRFAEAAQKARNRVLTRAAALKLITADDFHSALLEAVPGVRRNFPSLAPQLAQAVVKQNPSQTVHRLTLDAALQASLETLARERAAALGPHISVAIVVAENTTGNVLASVGGADYYSKERAGSLDLTKAIRSPGSALKPFIYAQSFAEGIAHPETMLEDRPSRYGLYVPENFDLTFQGAVSARQALQMSLNVPAVDLLSTLGPQKFLSALRAGGANIVLPNDAAPGLSVGLGGLGISLQDMTQLYVGLARGGSSAKLNFNADDTGFRESRAFIEPVAAWYVTDILRGAPPPLNAVGGRFSYKTGTSYGFRDAWAMGYDRKHTLGVWVGRADGTPVPGLVGRIAAAPILFDAFSRTGIDLEPFPQPKGALIAKNSDLPPPLRRTHNELPKATDSLASTGLKIAFPPDGAKLDLGSNGTDAPELILKAQGGVLPLTWMVDGKPLALADMRRQSSYLPQGRGFANILVMDANGATDSVTVKLQ